MSIVALLNCWDWNMQAAKRCNVRKDKARFLKNAETVLATIARCYPEVVLK